MQISDMEPETLKALLSFIYSDSPPDMEEDEDDGCGEGGVASQHLLTAADIGVMLICEEKLCGYIGVLTVTTILALAEQRHCRGLKEAHLEFLSSPNLQQLMERDGLEPRTFQQPAHLSSSNSLQNRPRRWWWQPIDDGAGNEQRATVGRQLAGLEKFVDF
ncbi:hypothetical protein E2562_006661 [Oryza meyeriana var. granulata]|uniref:BPM/SPOP BACK domain-containing protein n=1 Tax=Oryza meyeriana var. granulata TaxID=110450 RepID=A0A6G1EG11_9ORYZ|nr:hypothetical protein E2562_006661 [Oryza meyeriana var. granulata]